MMFYLKIIILICLHLNFLKAQAGPDPWNYDISDITYDKDDKHVPPDIRMTLNKKNVLENKGTTGICEWSFKRMLAIMLKTGQIQEDGNIVVSLQLKFDQNHWQMLNEYIKTGTPITEDIFRKSLGYIEHAIYKPSISEKIIMAWTDHIQIYMSEYRMHIIWVFGTLATASLTIWLWTHMSHRHIFIISFVILYMYEIFISYKQAEEKEYQKFMNALNSCKWYFWTSHCDIPPPDILTFLKHMNPSKIGVRMFTTVISEPMVTFSAIIKPIIHDVTDGLWWPLDKIAYGIITVSLNILIILIFILIICNFIFNVPISIGLGLISVAFKQRKRTLFPSNESNALTNNDQSQRAPDNVGSISNSTLDKILDVCAQALAIQNNKVTHKAQLSAVTDVNKVDAQFNISNIPTIKRSSSTGRLPSSSTFENNNTSNFIRQRKNGAFKIGGGGDAS
ncbi:hypothetical protein K1T71_004444 [Dendrolimus kikuchii]|uniref:Uncharacterized protein n=1 Tax=Dendrolimus kikuchii TaxID=765133 RepID=A0ACC1D7G4_9NEOP|nr:hypothetical protein K1T71_004444 [Dendrolimus kikuchii]